MWILCCKARHSIRIEDTIIVNIKVYKINLETHVALKFWQRLTLKVQIRNFFQVSFQAYESDASMFEKGDRATMRDT